MTSPDVILDRDALLRLAADILAAAGTAPSRAETWAQVLVWANLRGMDSHGVLRIPPYLEMIRTGSIRPEAEIRIERRRGAVAVMEADRAPGPVAMTAAMDEAIAMARESGVGWCSVRSLSHAGAIGFYALQAARAGMAGVAMQSSIPNMAYHGARAAGLSSNPLAIAVPAGRRPPFLLDMATSAVSFGKVLEARDQHKAVPLGWGLDAGGEATTDPARITTLLPLGGAKGSGLSFMIECLTGLAVLNPAVATALAGKADGRIMNGMTMAVDLDALGDLGRFREEADRLGDALAALPPAEGAERVLLPGERGDAILKVREAEGIPIPQTVWARLVEAAEALGVSPPKGR